MTELLARRGERIHPASAFLASEAQHLEGECAEHDLHVFQAARRMDEILLSNFIELGSVDAIKELARAAYGPGLLAPWLVRAELKDGSLQALPLGPRKLKRRWGIAYLKGRRLAFGGENFVSVCEKVLNLIIPSAIAALVIGLYENVIETFTLTAVLGCS